MGANSRERREAKQKAREREQRRRRERLHAGPFDGGHGPVPLPTHLAGSVVHDAVMALHSKNSRAVERCCEVLANGAGWVGGGRAVDAAVVASARRDLSALWDRGWQPVDLVRLVRREYGARHASMAVDLMATEIRGYATATVDERWEAQLRDLDAVVWWERDDGYLMALGQRDGLTRSEAVRVLLEVLHVVRTCPPIQILCPPPGKARRGSLSAAVAGTREADPRHLERVRALLAKAESTSFEAEADAYTAKAQELMARHSIDYALLTADSGTREQPVGRRIGVENPYEAPKVLLLDAVAGANRCRAIWSRNFGFVTVLGFPQDIDAVELLFTSLLVQATTAMTHAGSHRDAYGRSTTRSFRQSFLTSFAQRIGERLSDATREATAQAGRDLAGLPEAERLLPVLASRDAAVGAMADELFPTVVGRGVAISNREGWASGRAAADRAHLTARQAVDTGA